MRKESKTYRINLRLTPKMYAQVKLLTERCNMQRNLDRLPANLSLADILREIIKQKFEPASEEEEIDIRSELASFEFWPDPARVEVEIIEMLDYEDTHLLIKKLKKFECLERAGKLTRRNRPEFEKVKGKVDQLLDKFESEIGKVRDDEARGKYRSGRGRG